MTDIEQQTATAIEINTLNDTEVENKEKDGASNGYHNDGIKRIDTVFGTAMSLKEAFDEDDVEMYEPTNWRLSIYWAHLWIIYTFFTIGGDNTISAIAIVVYAIDIIVHIIMIIIAAIRRTQNGNNNTFHQSLNIMLGIKKKHERNAYNLDAISGQYVGTIFVIMAINMNLIMIAYRLWSIAENGLKSRLATFGSNSLLLPSLGVMFALLCAKFYTIKDEVVIEMLDYKDNKILKIEHNHIGKDLNTLIYDKTLKKWQKSLHFANRKGEYFVIFLFSMAFTIYGADLDRTGEGYGGFAWFYFIWACMSGAFALSLLFYFFTSSIKYFSYSTLVMKQLTKPIEGDSVQDFVLWWQFRRHYIENDVRLTRRIINVFLTAGIIISLVLLLLTMQWILAANSIDSVPSYAWKLMAITICIFGLILYLGQNATLYYEEQLKHKWMLIREKLRIESKNYDEEMGANNKNDDGDMRTREDEQLLRVIDAMITDIETTVIAIEMGGVKITPGIMLLIRGYIASGCVAMAAALF